MNDRRSYDAWGAVRAQQSGGDPKLRYCANLGHKQDDESGLIYMRARYYEPSSGRFVSEDPKNAGLNWYAYCSNDPLVKADFTGNASFFDFLSGSCEECWDKLEEFMQANAELNNLQKRIMDVMFKWAEDYASILGEDGFTVFGEEPLQFGVQGAYRINFHFAEDMAPHAYPHMELAVKGMSEKIYAWFTEYGLKYTVGAGGM